jgi:hypothetical protein
MILDTQDVFLPIPIPSNALWFVWFRVQLDGMGADCVVKHMNTSEQAKVVEDKPGH